MARERQCVASGDCRSGFYWDPTSGRYGKEALLRAELAFLCRFGRYETVRRVCIQSRISSGWRNRKFVLTVDQISVSLSLIVV